MARKTPQPSGEIGWMIEVDETDIDVADRFLKQTIPRAKEVIALTSAQVVKRPLVTEEGSLQVVYAYITTAGKRGVTTTELLRKLKVMKDDLKKYIINLMEEGKIVATRKKSRRGRPAIKFYDSKYKNLIPPNEEIIDSKFLDAIW